MLPLRHVPRVTLHFRTLSTSTNDAWKCATSRDSVVPILVVVEGLALVTRAPSQPCNLAVLGHNLCELLRTLFRLLVGVGGGTVE